jgi:hypothetical protein
MAIEEINPFGSGMLFFVAALMEIGGGIWFGCG